MKDEEKSKEELNSELARLRQRIAELEASEAEQKRTEEALRESESRYRAVVEGSPDAIFLTDVHTKRTLEANTAFQQMLGYTSEEIRELSLYDLIAAEREDIDRRFSYVLSLGDGVSFTHERRYRRKDGSLVDVWVRGTFLFYGGRKVACTLVRDLTERKQAETALRESEERYRAVMEQSPDGIYLVDVETKRIMEANLSFNQMLGYSTEEVRGLHLYDFIAAQREDIDQRFEKLLQQGLVLQERQYRKKDGTLLDVWVSASVISCEGKRLTCTIVRDLTERKGLEAQLLRAQRMESIGLLAGGIAHDLNNILSPILMNAELLQQALSDVNQQKMLASLISNAHRGADIVKQILTFSRGREGELLMVSPRYLLKEMERFFQETFPKSIRIVTEIPKDIWSLSGDFTQLHQVLMNLCLNARDAMPDGGTLTLSAENMALDETYCVMNPEAQPGPYVLLSVSDTGSGIPPDLLEKIFDPFFTTKEKGKGTGLGLSIALALVKSHQGFLRVYSEVGKGTRFHMYLPASLPPEKVQAEEEKAPLPTGSGELLLVVEDEASLREITQLTLEAYGYKTLTASEGAEAVAHYAQHPEEIQLVVTDMAMPIMDGPCTIRALRRMNPSLKIIAVSGLEAEGLVAEASEVGVQALLQKPFTAENLLRTVREVLEKQ